MNTADMVSGSRMCRAQPSLLAFLALSFLISVADGDPLEVMSAPNLLRVGATENIFIEIQDYTLEDPVNVDIIVKNHPTKDKELESTSVTLNKTNKFQDLARITIPAEHFSKDPKVKQYIYLQARFPDRELEKIVLVSFQSGYIFIQTDKTMYTPGTRVFYRLFAVRPGMEPVEREDNMDTSVTIEITTPDDIIVETNHISVKSGIYSASYQLAEVVSTGLWKVVAKFESNLQQSFVAEFEVKEYVLPSFEVKLTSEIPFFYVDSEELDINIKARYLFGEEVDGKAYVVFGIMLEGQKRSLSSSLQRVPIGKGNGVAKLKKQHITDTFQNILDLEGSSIYVSVSVLTESGSEMVEAELRGIQIVKSPYTIHFKKTRQYFRPGISFNVAIEVVNPDGSPVKGIKVVVKPGDVEGVTESNGMARLSVNTEEIFEPLLIKAKTSVPGIPLERQASAEMTALPFTNRSNNYIHIGVDKAEVKLGDNLKINLNVNRQRSEENDITYLILSRGQLVKHGRHRNKHQTLISLNLIITKEMLPSFRIVAYYHPNSSEVVSDSLWVDVEDSCMGSLKLEQARGENSYEPRNSFGLKITGDPESTVGLVAVDKGVYVLNNKHRLTQKKIWDVVEKYDTGCTPGGGKDSINVFFDAGLMFETNTASGTPHRINFSCKASSSSSSSSRKKRATTIMEVRTSLASQFEDKEERECCLDGMTDVPVSYSCERRSEYILDGQACVKAFLNCCREMERQQNERKEDALQLARSEEDDESYMDSTEIVSRTKFPESWFWYEYKLSACPKNNPLCETTFLKQSVFLPDSITTWQFTAISMSRTHGICVADPLEIVVRKKFFIDLRLPYSAVRGEQLEIKAVLHNYTPRRITVRVDLKEETDLCSAAYKHGKFRQEVKVEPKTTRAVPFIIIPMKNGKFPIQVKAAVRETFLNDGITKMLLVVPEGVLIESPINIALDPAREGVDGIQEEMINSGIPTAEFVPGAPVSTIISLTGREQMNGLFDYAISGNSMGNLIKQPHGCGEQNMIGMTLPVIATMYLDKTNQWETVGLDKRKDAIRHITTGYTAELKYRKGDGSFAIFHHAKSSTWLTAYVAKVFSMAYNLVAVQESVICDAIKYLILTSRTPNGMFTELRRVYHREMTGGVLGTDSHVSMTAFCLIALQESRRICSATASSLPSSIDQSVSYLEKHLSSVTNPYAAAMASYALANENKLNKEILYKFASSDRSHWPVRRDHVLTLEATAYALLALVKTGAFEEAKPIVRWLSQQQKDGGGYGSTQATIMVYQAVAEYWTTAKEPEYNLDVNIVLPGRSLTDKYKFNNENFYSTRTSKFNSINKDIKVTANGTGEAMFRMVSLYYALPKEKESDCEMFDLNVQLHPDKGERMYKLTIEVMFKDKQRNTTMSILDVGLPTGFIFIKDDLGRLSKGRARIIAKYEMDKVLSERGSLIIYLDKISNVRSDEISFRIQQKTDVGVLQPAAVSVYEYNNKKHCMKFYRPERRNGELLKLCKDNECTCAEENCSMQKKEGISDNDRSAKACEITDAGTIDFVYKAEVKSLEDGLFTDIYTVRVLQVVKEGTTDVGPQSQLRTFLSYQHCRDALDLKQNKTYLIMGTSKDIRTASTAGPDGQQHSFQYVLGERTWIEYWPTVEECQTNTYRATCLGIEKLVLQYETFGCET
ncbi:complement C3-like [Acanthochromis polyacanthus]|uniref:complement C3-like n=1 Tax=Acanthochromis polyacanthus TaxID=80966 RepID=UPI002234C8DC|nr:complement C3-like [Acanthochromis polyacanthus]